MKITRRIYVMVIAGILGVLFVCDISYGWYLSDRIVPGTWVGSVAVGGLTRDQAAERLTAAAAQLESSGIQLNIGGTMQTIQPDAIGFDINLTEAIETAFVRGHSGARFDLVRRGTAMMWHDVHMPAPVHVNVEALSSQLSEVATAVDTARLDIRLAVTGRQVKLLDDTKPGKGIDLAESSKRIMAHLEQLSTTAISLDLQDDPPRADSALAESAVTDAQKILARSLTISYEDVQFFVSRERVGTWIISEYDGPQLKAGLDSVAIAQYVATIAEAININAEPPRITTEGGRVTGFTPSKVGRVVGEDKLIALISDTLFSRTTTKPMSDVVSIPMKTSQLALTGLDAASGIKELVGKATTPFTGSPKNRISNIKNGVKFLSGTIIPAGAEFSTLATLGVIDNTTGYLPELVIKGDRTVPDFGGGLCQVSTTLFRTVLDAGLPVTARRNHSFRVSYYEKDGTGKKIGPGLDATIFQPDLDFRFRNDTATSMLLVGYVIGDKITFELYGTKDGRTGMVDGPHTLTESPAGPPQYINDDTLAKGVTKQVETPHPGGSAVANYTITYADGRIATQEFKSWYRPWPAKYLVGTKE